MSFLPKSDLDYLNSKSILFAEIVEGSRKTVVFNAWRLPAKRYNVQAADVLVLIPKGYPDIAPDMFYLLPWVRRVPSNTFPARADQPFAFAGQKWQRWSRHNREWRPGVDGIWTMLKRIERALEVAE